MQPAVSGGWRGELQSLPRLRRALLPARTRGGVGRAQRGFRGTWGICGQHLRLSRDLRSRWLGWDGPGRGGLLGSPQIRSLTVPLFLSLAALEDASRDISPAVSSLARQTAYVLRALERAPRPIFQMLRDRLRRACRTRPRLSGCGWLQCWSSSST